MKRPGSILLLALTLTATFAVAQSQLPHFDNIIIGLSGKPHARQPLWEQSGNDAM